MKSGKRNHTRGARSWAAVGIGLALALTACAGGGGADGGDEPDAPEPTHIRVALPGGPNVSLSTYLAAQGTGAYESRGLEVETVEFATGVDALAALTGGAVEITNTSGLDLIRAAQQDTGIVCIFVALPASGSAIVAKKSLEDEYGDDFANFADARWGYAREGTISTFFLQTLAESSGLTWESLNRAALGSQAAMLASLEADRVDIVSMDATTSAKSVEMGIGYIVLNTSDPEATEPFWPQQVGSVIATTRDYLEANPEAVQAFVTATLEGTKALQDNIDDPEAVLGLFTPEVASLLDNSWEMQWSIAKPVFPHVDGVLSDELLQNTFGWATSSGALPSDAVLPPSSTFIDNSLVEKAHAELE